MTGEVKKLVFVSTDLGFGGAEIQILNIAKVLKQRGWSISMVSMMEVGELAELFEIEGISVDSLRMPRGIADPRGIFKLARHIKQYNPTVVHSHMIHANLLTRICRLVCKMPLLICTAHSVNEGGAWADWTYRLTDRLADLTTQVSKAGLARYIENGAVPLKKIRHIRNGVDTTIYAPDAYVRGKKREELGINHEFTWLAVGRLNEPKDYPNMLKAFEGITAKYKNVRLLIAGKGHLRGYLEKMAIELGIDKHIKFLGLRKDIPQLMKMADAYLMSSAWEGLPLVLLEAQSSGLPVVTTNVGGNSEIVRDGVSGFIVQPHKHERLQEAMQKVTSLTSDEIEKMGLEGRKFIEDFYSLDVVVDQWEKIYSGKLSELI